MKIFHIMLEELEERYTKMSNQLINNELSKIGELIEIPRRTFSDKVETGKVLDANGTIFGQSMQMADIAVMFRDGKVENGDVFFISDLWTHNLASIPYMAMLNNIEVFIFAWAHAGSYTNGDFMQPGVMWGADVFELAFLRMLDGVFVGSNYHKNQLLSLRVPNSMQEEISRKIFVTGNPLDTKSINSKISKPILRVNDIIWPHRFDLEKGPSEMLDIINSVMMSNINARFTMCNSRKNIDGSPDWLKDKLTLVQTKFKDRFFIKYGVTKERYYQLLAESKVFLSTTLEENFGYCLAEACALGCYPVAPNDFSHKEILSRDNKFLYNDIDNAVDLINNALKIAQYETPDTTKFVDIYNRSASRMAQIIDGYVNAEDLDEMQSKYTVKHTFVSPRYLDPLIGKS